MTRAARFRRGFSLIEAVIAMLLVSVMLTAALQTVGAARVSMGSTAERARAAALAERLMEEILTRPYEDPLTPGGMGPEAGEAGLARALLNDVDDFDGLSETPPRDASGVPLLDVGNWTWSVRVQHVPPAALGSQSGSATGMKRIRVTVSTGRTSVTLDGYRAAAWVGPAPEASVRKSNTAPVPVLDVSTTVAAVGSPVTFSATRSFDAESDPLTYEWDLGAAGKTSGATAAAAYVTAGLHTVHLTVRDGRGGVARATRVLEVR